MEQMPFTKMARGENIQGFLLYILGSLREPGDSKQSGIFLLNIVILRKQKKKIAHEHLSCRVLTWSLQATPAWRTKQDLTTESSEIGYLRRPFLSR